MGMFRVEVVETTHTTREQWFQAETEQDARTQAEGDDWRTWSVVETLTDTGIAFIEEVEDNSVEK